jgi:PAS domain S-box-containing protein
MGVMKRIILKLGRGLFSPPLFADGETRLAARLLYPILWAQILSVLVLGMLLSVLDPPYSRYWLGLIGVTMTVSLALRALAGSGRTRLASILLVGQLWLLITFFSWTSSGLGARGAWGYFIVAFIAGMLLGRWSGIAAAALCSLSTLLLAFVSQTRSSDPVRFWLINTLYLVLVLLLQNLASRSIRESLQQAQKELGERRHAEEALRARENLLSSIFRVAPTGIGVVRDRVLIEINDRILEMTGRTREELLGKISRVLYPSDAEFEYVGKEKYRQIAERGTGTVETRWQHKDGRLIDVLLSSTPINPMDPSVGVMFTALDITERKRAEDALRESEEKYRITMDVAPIGIYIIQDMRFKFVNLEMARMHGFEPAEMVDSLSPPDDLVAPEHRELVRRSLLNRELGVRGASYEIRARRRDGSFFDALVWGQGIQFHGRPASVGTLLDISQRKQAEKELRESERRYHTLFEAANDAIFVMKGNYFFDCNSRTLEMYGCRAEQIIGVSPDRFSPPLQPDGRNSRKKALEKIAAAYAGVPQFFEWLHCRADGTPFITEVSLNRFELESGPHLLAIVRDIAGRKTLEDQLRQAQKMEAVGILAGGVAHDFNNILSTIVGYASLLQMQEGLDGKLKEYLERILASTERAASLTHSLLAFSRKQAIDLQPIDINDAIYGFHKVLARLIGEDIDFRVSLASGSLVVDADIRQIEQVLMNLATNARDAMPQGGTLLITTRSEAVKKGKGEMPGGSYAVISLSDTGMGMEQEVQNHLFEPFFTTKDIGKGTGLGLAIVYGIIKNHKGFIFMESTANQGTIFHIYLPLKIEAVPKSRRKFQAALPRGSETILLVEDDSAVRQATRSMLEEFGYTVLEAGDGLEALAVFERNAERVQLLLSDLIMPKMNGKETQAKLLKAKPDLKTIFMSGYTSDIIARKGIHEPGMHLLLKPLHPAALLEKVRDVLDS